MAFTPSLPFGPERVVPAGGSSLGEGDLDPELRCAEMRHRYGNVFAMLEGLIGLRLRHLSESEARRQLLWFGDVVIALARLNRQLDNGRDDFMHYLEESAAFWSGCGMARRVQIKFTAEPVAFIKIRPNSASSLALIVNELVANAYEHAFPSGQEGEIRFEFHHIGEEYVLKVADNGRGLQAEGNENLVERRTGLALVEALARSLGGRLTLESGADGMGTTVILRVFASRVAAD